MALIALFIAILSLLINVYLIRDINKLRKIISKTESDIYTVNTRTMRY